MLPETAEELAAVVALATSRHSVIPRGTGTGLEGGALVDGRGGILVSTERDEPNFEINEEAMYNSRRSRRITETTQKEAGKRGLLYAGDPAAVAMLYRRGHQRRQPGRACRTTRIKSMPWKSSPTGKLLSSCGNSIR